MEPISTAFATIVGLVAAYKSEKTSQSDDEYKEFVQWLGEHRHQQIIDLLNLSATTSISIKALLNQDRTALLARLESIDRVLAGLSSQIEGMSDLALAMKPGSEISEQAMSILVQMEEAEASSFVIGKYLGGHIAMHLSDGGGGQIKYDEPRFLEDDLATLSSLGFLLIDYNSRGEPFYRITRQASSFVKLSGRF